MPRKPTATVDTFRDYRDKDAAHKSEMRTSVRDIGADLTIANPKRRAACTASLRLACETYWPEQFTLAWSADHLRVLAHIERAAIRGGLFAFAMPRGNGKTTICECGGVWSYLTGRRKFIVLIGASEKHATEVIDSIKTELETNELLAEDFPEALHCIRALEGIAHRANGQIFRGERTHVGWTADELILPDLKLPEWRKLKDHKAYVDKVGRPKCAGSIIRVAGITGRIRGMKHKRADGSAVRPDFVLLDDPQTDDSAKSPSQCEYRESVLAGAILGLAGRGKRIAGVMPCTVIRPGDMADRILDRSAHPDWNGERTKMVYAWPSATKLWDQYAQMRGDGLRAGDDGAAATKFYGEHRAAMDAGAKMAWPECFQPNELSAIQNAMDLRLKLGDAAFFAEYQNEPIKDDTRQGKDPEAPAVAKRCSGMERYAVPSSAHHVTAFIDVHQDALFSVTTAFEADFTAHVVNYLAWPDPERPYFTLRDIRRTITLEAQAAGLKSPGLEGAIMFALGRLVDQLVATKLPRDDGSVAAIDRILIDANWGKSTEVVYEFCRRSPHAAILTPWHGKFIGGSSTPMAGWQKKRGDRVGLHWRQPAAVGRQVRHVLGDVNFWKSFVMDRLQIPLGDPGAISLWGNNPAAHRLFSEHCAAEYRVPVEGRGRRVDEWKWRPEAFDNHWWDGLVGCCVAASMEGVSIGVGEGAASGPRQRLRLSDLARSRGASPPTPAPPPAPTARAPVAEMPNPTPPLPTTPATDPPRHGRLRLSDLMRTRGR